MTTEFVYREFYDVPRHIVVPRNGGRLLLVSRFDEATDDYEDQYGIYWLPSDVDLDGPWEGLEKSAAAKLGTVKVRDVVFDQTRRRSLDLASLGIAIPGK